MTYNRKSRHLLKNASFGLGTPNPRLTKCTCFVKMQTPQQRFHNGSGSARFQLLQQLFVCLFVCKTLCCFNLPLFTVSRSCSHGMSHIQSHMSVKHCTEKIRARKHCTEKRTLRSYTLLVACAILTYDLHVRSHEKSQTRKDTQTTRCQRSHWSSPDRHRNRSRR